MHGRSVTPATHLTMSNAAPPLFEGRARRGRRGRWRWRSVDRELGANDITVLLHFLEQAGELLLGHAGHRETHRVSRKPSRAFDDSAAVFAQEFADLVRGRLRSEVDIEIDAVDLGLALFVRVHRG